MRLSPARPRLDETMLLLYIMAVLTGLVMIYSTSSMLAESRFGSHLHFFKNQIIWSVLSIGAVVVLSRIDLRRYAVYSAPFLFLTIALLAVVFLMPARNGSHRWLFLGPFSLQPSELFKFAAIFYLAFSLSNPRRNLGDLKQLLYPYVPLIGIGLALILLEPDLGRVIVTAITVVCLFFLAGAKVKHLAAGLLPLIGVAAVMVFGLGYKKARVLDFIAAIGDPLQGSYQAKQAALTLGSGGIFGVGLGDGRQKLFFLPYPHTDFIFAATGEELGLIGLLVILAVFLVILWRGLRTAYIQPDKFGYLLAAGMTVSLFINIAVNVCVVTSLLPVTGLPLPFISYGGSSLLTSSAAIGVLLNLSREGRKT